MRAGDTHLFSHRSILLLYLHCSISLPLSISPSPSLSPPSHLHNIVAEDVFHLFAIRLEGGKITLPLLSSTKRCASEFSRSGASGGFGNHSKERKWSVERSRVKITYLVTFVRCNMNLYEWEHGWSVLLKNACACGSVWCGWTVRAESVWTHYCLANVRSRIGFTLRPFSLSFLMSSHVPELLLPSELRHPRRFWQNENWHFGFFLRIQRFIFSEKKDKSCFNKALDKKRRW